MTVRKTSELAQEISPDSFYLDIIKHYNGEIFAITRVTELISLADEVQEEDKEIVVPKEASMLRCGPICMYFWNEDYRSLLSYLFNFRSPIHIFKGIMIYDKQYIFFNYVANYSAGKYTIDVGEVY